MIDDNCGILREHEKSIGLLKNSNNEFENEAGFERLLKSSLSLDPEEKIRIVACASRLSKKQIDSLTDVFTNEIREFNSFYPQEKNKIEYLIKSKELEWIVIEKYIKEYISDVTKLDKRNNLVPSSIQSIMEKFVKGQGEATKTLSTLLYYHHKVHVAHQNKSSLPFDTPEPILISGATGTGKSYMLEIGCEIIGLPFMHVDCSALVSAGIVGYTIEDIMKNLLRKVDYKVKRAETAVVLLDEVDKLLVHHDGQSVLYQLLRFVEGANVPLDGHKVEDQLKSIYGISTNNMLFIFAGSFQKLIDGKGNSEQEIIGKNKNTLSINDIQKTDLPKELLGRINKIVILNNLKREDFREILNDNKASPLEQIKAMLKINDYDFSISNEKLESILDDVEISPYGARALKHIVWEHFEPILHDAPEANHST